MGTTKKTTSQKVPGKRRKYGTSRRRTALNFALAVDDRVDGLRHLLLLLAGERGRDVALLRERCAGEDQLIVRDARILLQQDLLHSGDWRRVVDLVLDLRLVLGVVDVVHPRLVRG